MAQWEYLLAAIGWGWASIASVRWFAEESRANRLAAQVGELDAALDRACSFAVACNTERAEHLVRAERLAACNSSIN